MTTDDGDTCGCTSCRCAVEETSAPASAGVEVVPLDEPSMDDYPEAFADDPTSPGFVPATRPPVKIRDGVRDSETR